MFPNLNLLLTSAGTRRVSTSGGQVNQITAKDWQKRLVYSEEVGSETSERPSCSYAKAYGKTADPLTFWSTHAKYRVASRSMGTYGTYGEITAVDASIGAPSGHATAILIFPSGTPTSTPIISLKQYFPYLMDVETGNNPKIDKYIEDKINDRKIAKAGAEFQKLPASTQTSYRYVAVTQTLLAYPGDVMFQSKVGDTALWSASLDRFANAFTGKGATSAAQFKAIRNQIANTQISKRWAGRMADGSVANQFYMLKSPFSALEEPSGRPWPDGRPGFQKAEYKKPVTDRPFSWASATQAMNKEHRQIIYGLQVHTLMLELSLHSRLFSSHHTSTLRFENYMLN